ncbi:MAG: hypothetical protein A2189_08240 [Paenibacillus sp. RIFOXYA1_FULL_44_5]|nr:MAG: hypothetical protein A2189_08240 [Paenibacillus sp. RIFOXYA1_FULL_44_5]
MGNDTISLLQMKIPDFLKGSFGLTDLDMTQGLSILGFYSIIYVYINLFGGIYAMLLAAGIISKEESDKTIEFLLAKPVSRMAIVSNKLLSVLTYVLLFNLAITITNYIAFSAVQKGDLDMKAFYLFAVGLVLLDLLFAAVGTLMSVFVVKAKTILPVSIGVVIGTFFLEALAGMSTKTEFLKYFSPFSYVKASDIMHNHRIAGIYLIIMAVIIALSIASTYYFYNRKNISV